MDPASGMPPPGTSGGYLSMPNPTVTVSNDSILNSVVGPVVHPGGQGVGVIATTGTAAGIVGSSIPMPMPSPHQQTAMIMNQANLSSIPIPQMGPSGGGMQQQQQPASMPIPMDVDQGVGPPNGNPNLSHHQNGTGAGKANGTNSSMSDTEKNALMVVLSFLKKHNLKDTEDSLKKEAKIAETDIKGTLPLDSDVQTVLSSYASDENPDEYTDAYTQLKNFIDTSLDAYKYEVGQVLWPVFVHMYLELIYNEHESQGQSFFTRFSKMQETFYDDDLISLGTLKKKSQLVNSENPFRSLTSGLYSGQSGIGKRFLS